MDYSSARQSAIEKEDTWELQDLCFWGMWLRYQHWCIGVSSWWNVLLSAGQRLQETTEDDRMSQTGIMLKQEVLCALLCWLATENS